VSENHSVITYILTPIRDKTLVSMSIASAGHTGEYMNDGELHALTIGTVARIFFGSNAVGHGRLLSTQSRPLTPARLAASDVSQLEKPVMAIIHHSITGFAKKTQGSRNAQEISS
jgi:hypothetical protein